MRIRFLQDEDFVNYKKASMFIGTSFCDWKCCKEQNISITICQNEPWSNQPVLEVPDEKIVKRYIDNPITSAIVFGGLEPLLQQSELLSLLTILREHTRDDVVIYTGYYPDEIKDFLWSVKELGPTNIIMKYGRFILNDAPRYDEVLGITLASSNQYAERIS